MVHLLLIIIYLSFISLGLPDALLGAAWPIMSQEFSVPVSVGNKIAQAVFQYKGNDIQLEGYEIFLDTDKPRWVLTEHTEIRWVDLEEIPSLHFVDSDLLIYPQVVEYFATKGAQK